MDILIVDDDDGVRDSLNCFIESEGHRCQTARNGREALKLLGYQTPHIIIADIDMPEMSGLELFSHVHSEYPEKKIDMLLITGGDYSKNFGCAATDSKFSIIKKPINPAEIRKFLSSA